MYHAALLAFKVSSFKGFFLVTSHFFLFSKFLFALHFGNLVITCLGVDLFGFHLFGNS